MAGNDIVKVMCPQCDGGLRNHKVLREVELASEETDGMPFEGKYQFIQIEEKYQIVQCQGCESVRFRASHHVGGRYDMTGVRVYPEHIPNARKSLIPDSAPLPPEVDRIYRETITAFNAGALILAGAGLRAIVEAICINANSPGNSLQQRIDGLVTLNLLARPQADLLHEERYLGNAAVHEVEPPSGKDVEDGLAIVETLLNTIYIAQASAQRLRMSRIAKEAKKAKVL